MNPRLRPPQRLSLALSGGLDSRLLLALRRRGAPAAFGLHVFGPADHPDVRVSSQIAAEEGLPLLHLDDPLPPPEQALPRVQEFLARTNAYAPASEWLHQRHYERLGRQNAVLVDGSAGELVRRMYFEPRKPGLGRALRAGEPGLLYPYLAKRRSPIFGAEAAALMRRGARQQTEALWEALPPLGEWGEENLLDLIVVRTELPRFLGQGLPHADAEGAAYYPYGQRSVVQAVFQTPVPLRKRSRLARRLIRTRRASLARHPLVRSYPPCTAYPFPLGHAASALWARAKAGLGLAYSDASRLTFLRHLREPVLDLVHARAAREYAAYDHARLVSRSKLSMRARRPWPPSSTTGSPSSCGGPPWPDVR